MEFPVSGVHCTCWLPPAVALVVVLVTASAGISGAFLVPPFQIIYNSVAVPGSVFRHAIVRARYLPYPRHMKLFVGLVLLGPGIRLLRRASPAASAKRMGRSGRARLTAAALAVGIIGGIYGVGGGAMIAPFAMTSLRQPASVVASPALLGTLITSIVGVASYALLAGAARPDWMLGLLFGSGGLIGGYCGARLRQHQPERWLRRGLGILVTGLAINCAASPLRAQCVVENPGGSKLNINRPADSDVPAAGFSPLAALNKALPNWVCFAAGYRARLEGYSAGGFRAGNSDYYLLTRLRFGVSFRPRTWLKTYTELQDATAFWKTPPLGPPYQSTWDLRRAYLDLGDPEQSPLSLRVGRQDLAFGHLRLVGTAYWRNASRGYDAVRMAVNWGRLRLNAFASSPVVCMDNGLSHHQQGNNFHGIYASIRNAASTSLIEPYVLWRLTPGYRTERGAAAKLDEKISGLRWAGTASHFDYDLEITGEWGSVGADRIRTWAWSAVTGYTFSSRRWKPRLFVKYDFASGDRNPTDGVRGTFDQLYPNIHDHHGLADQVAWQNLKSIRSGARVSPRSNWILAAAYNDWWLANPRDAFYNASGAIVARDPLGRSGSHIGREFDAQSSYRPNRHLEFGVGIGYIRSGQLLLRTMHAAAYTYPYVMVNYNVN